MNFPKQLTLIFRENQVLLTIWAYFYNLRMFSLFWTFTPTLEVSNNAPLKKMWVWWWSKPFQRSRKLKVFNEQSKLENYSCGVNTHLVLVRSSSSFFTKNKALNLMVLNHFFFLISYYHKWYRCFKLSYLKSFFSLNNWYTNSSTKHLQKSPLGFWYRLTLLKI